MLEMNTFGVTQTRVFQMTILELIQTGEKFSSLTKEEVVWLWIAKTITNGMI